MRIYRDTIGPTASLVLTVALTACVCGCGSGHSKTYPVSGKVVFDDGAPLAGGGFIGFESTSGERLPINARGRIRDDGTFVLSTFDDEDGAVAGTHRVLVRARRGAADNSDVRTDTIPEAVIDPRFGRYETSGLQFTVAEGANEFTVEVQRPGRAEGGR